MIQTLARLLAILTIVFFVAIGSSYFHSQTHLSDVKRFVDLTYASEPGTPSRLRSLDIYIPAKGKDAPVMIMIHGGGWQNGDKSNPNVWQNKVPFFAQNNFIFVNINYRLSPAVQHPEHIRDVAEAVAWVYNNIGKYGGDRNKIFVMGHSAGAHLAALVATDERRLKQYGKDLSVIKGVILLDGAGYDIPAQMQGLTSFRRRAAIGEILSDMYVTAFTKEEAAQKDASPYYHIAKGKRVPPFLFFTAGGRAESVSQSAKMAAALKNAGIQAETVDVPDKNHAGINRDFGLPDEMITIRAKEFLDSILEGKR